MKKTFLSLIAVFLLFGSNAQITKGNWLLGGSGTISRQQQKLIGARVKSTIIDLKPNLGYFIVDKFSVGLMPGIEHSNIKKTNAFHSKMTFWSVGPFIRYYFLPVENITNFFAHSSYQLRTSSTGEHSHTMLFSAGPVVYFNSSVGLELTGNYRINRYNPAITYANTFFIAIGLQVHLKSDND